MKTITDHSFLDLSGKGIFVTLLFVTDKVFSISFIAADPWLERREEGAKWKCQANEERRSRLYERVVGELLIKCLVALLMSRARPGKALRQEIFEASQAAARNALRAIHDEKHHIRSLEFNV